jgi:hypothetical protein
MNLRNEFNRIGHIFTDGVEKTHKAAGALADEGAKRANGLARRVQDRADVRALVTTEERIVRHVRENPALYLMGAALLIGALIAKLILEARQSPQDRPAPLL